MMLIVLFVAVFLMMFAPEGQSEKQRGQRYRGKKHCRHYILRYD